MVSAERQTIMETNRSLRNIKTELENLLEKGIIDESVFDTIHGALPDESPLSGPLRTTSSTNAMPARTPAQSTGPASPPVQAMQNLGVNNSSSRNTPLPPSYEDTPPPGLPQRAAAAKAVIANARALYRYAGAEARDLFFEKDDRIAVHSYMNDDWWMGQNVRSGQEGIFPRNYVFVEQETDNGKAPQPAAATAYAAQPTYGYPQQQQQQNPYNSSVPPQAVADGGQPVQEGSGKAGQMGKKFGKKMGNAAIFGAGATIGSNIVNSIF